MSPKRTIANPLPQRLRANGFRFTPQRQHVYDVLLEKRDHPTAEEVFIRAKRRMPDISMATVYNCLDALVRSRLARQVTVDRAATRFCPNMREHCHFYCDDCNEVFDIDLPGGIPAGIAFPKGFKAARFELAVHGRCPRCGHAGGRPRRPVEDGAKSGRSRSGIPRSSARVDMRSEFKDLTGLQFGMDT